MSDSESFLARWSRRKRGAAARERGRATPKPQQPEAWPTATTAGSAPESEPVVNLADLPPIESIGPGCDVGVFLAPGVPAALARAALRRAWSADPAIRDFIGLSENSWDFKAPGGVPGFGSMTVEDARRLLDRLAGDPETAPRRQDSEPGSDERGSPPTLASEAKAPDCGAGNSGADRRADADDIAAQDQFGTGESSPSLRRQRHGSALPE